MINKEDMLELLNKWYFDAEKIAQEHFEPNEEWDDEEAYGRYDAIIKCRAELFRLVGD